MARSATYRSLSLEKIGRAVNQVSDRARTVDDLVVLRDELRKWAAIVQEDIAFQQSQAKGRR